MSINFNKSILVNQEYWIKQGTINLAGLLSNIGVNEELLKEEIKPEFQEKVIAIAQERLLTEQRSLITAVMGEEHFLPLSFLEIGDKQSLAVCRIVRDFSLKNFQIFIDNIKSEIKSRNITMNFDSVAKIKELFSISDPVAGSITGLNNSSSDFTPENKLTTSLGNLEALRNISANQLAKINPIPIGSGFLVGVTHLITNQHIIPDTNSARECVAQFNYAEDTQGNTLPSIDYQLAPEILFISECNLDYTLVQLKSGTFTRQAGSKFGWVQLVETEDNICPGLRNISIDNHKLVIKENTEENHKETEEEELKNYLPGDQVIIVQHPKGRKKEIALNDKVIDDGLYKNFLRYRTDSDYGSSGSPVFNNKWELVALHHAAIFKKTDPIKEDEVIAQQGVRICRIVEDLKKKSVSNSKLASFIEDFVVTSEQLNYPPLPSALEFDGESSYVDLGDLNLSIAEGITFEAWINRNSMSGDGTIVSQGLDFSVSWRVGKIWVNVRNNEFYTIDAVLNHNCWSHVAVTFSKDYSIVIYINGEIQTKSWPLKVDNKNNDNSKNNLHLGCGNFGYFTGFMAEVRIWGVACAPEQIKKNMYRPLTKNDQTNLRGYYRFQEEESYKVYNYFKVNKSTKNEEDNSNNSKEDELKWGLQLNGKTDFIDCGKDENFKIEDAITIEALVKKSELNNGIIVNQGGSWDKQPGYCLWINDNKIRVELQNNNHILVDTQTAFGESGEDTTISNFKLEKWYHIACTWSRNSTENIEIYVDGIKQKTTIPGDSANKLSDQRIEKFNVNLNIGRAEGYGFHFNGAIAEVRVWKKAREENDIKQNMYVKLQGKEEGLVGYWPLKEDEGGTAKNIVHNDSYGDGVVCGGKWLKPYYDLATNQGEYGVAYRTNRLRASRYPGLPLPFGLKFNEESDRVDCGNDNLSVTEAITVEAWFKHKYGSCVIVSRVDADQNGYSLSWNSGRISVALKGQNCSEKIVVYTKENAPQDSVWHHIAFTWEQHSNEVSLYIDGRLQDCVVEGSCKTIVFAGQTRSIGLFKGSLDNLKANFLIGCNEEKETYYNVVIADVRLWKVARTQDEIKANMSRRLRLTGEGNDLNGLVGYWRLDDGGEDKEVQNLVPDSQPGKIIGATWFPQPPKLIENPDTTQPRK